MRRLLLVLAAVALLLLGATAGAGGATPRSHLVVTRWSAHQAGPVVRGAIVVVNRGRAASAPGDHAEVEVRWTQGEPNGTRVRMAPTIHLAILPRLEPSQRRTVRFAATIPAEAPAGRRPLVACVERCRRIGWVTVGRVTGPNPPAPPAAPAAPTPPAGPVSTIPTDPIPYMAGTPFEVSDGPVPYWAFVPDSYDPSNLTPAALLVWLHGCGGYSEGDIWIVDPGEEAEPPQDWLTIAVGGREGDCWTPSVDEAKVMAALADVETHFNVDRQRVILGGYSSGGDLAYRTGFRHSSTFAGLLIENSSPFRDTESSAAESLGAATTKLPIVHLAHTGDTTYPLAGVRQEVGEVAAAGFPIELIERPGAHYDASTDSDLRELLLPHIDDGRLAPP
jgi:acetyl esterase/lipase